MSVNAIDYRKQVFGLGSSDQATYGKHERPQLISLSQQLETFNPTAEEENLKHEKKEAQRKLGIEKNPRDDLMSRETAHFRLTFS